MAVHVCVVEEEPAFTIVGFERGKFGAQTHSTHITSFSVGGSNLGPHAGILSVGSNTAHPTMYVTYCTPFII